jgi:hypothetical protein
VAGGLIVRIVTSRRSWPRPDFARAGAAGPLWPAALAVGGALALCFSAWQGWQLQSELERWQTLAASASERTQQARRAAAPPRGGAAAGEDARMRALAVAVVRDLDHAWPAALASIERATPRGVRWLGMSHDARRGELRLEGEADAERDAFVAVEALGREAGWQEVALQQVGATGAGAAAPVLRFVLTARRAAVAAP